MDEVQKVPDLLEEVHWLLEDTPTRFVLCGSSARRLRRRSHNLLGGRGVDFHMLPLTTHEIGQVDLPRALRHGLLPAHYLADDPSGLFRAYVNNYIKDTLLEFTLGPWRRKQKRRRVETAKFYVFDVGVANRLHPESPAIVEGSDRFGRAFEHFVINEVRAHLAYNRLDRPMTFWRTSSGFEVDLIVGDMDLAIECKSTREVRAADLKGMRALCEEHSPGRRLLVSRVETPRRTEDGIEIPPWSAFCRDLWAGGMIR